MQNMNKKALADIIAVTLIIVLTVIAISLVASYINREISGLSPKLDCLDAQVNQLLKIENVCYNQDSGEVELELSRSLQESTITRLGFDIITGNGVISSYSCGPETNCRSGSVLEQGQKQNYFFKEQGFEIHVSANSCTIDNSLIEPC